MPLRTHIMPCCCSVGTAAALASVATRSSSLSNAAQTRKRHVDDDGDVACWPFLQNLAIAAHSDDSNIGVREPSKHAAASTAHLMITSADRH